MTPQVIAVEAASKNKALNYILIGLGTLGMVGVFLVGRKVLENAQIIDDASERKMKRGVDSLESSGYTSPSFWQGLSESKKKELNAEAKRLGGIAAEIRKGFMGKGMLGADEDEEAIIGAVKKLRTKAEFSFTADVYQRVAKSDMWSDIKRALYGWADTSEDDINQVINHLKSLPKS